MRKTITILIMAVFIGICLYSFGTDFYDDVTFYGDFSLEAFPAVDNVSADSTYVANGTMTNATTYSYDYRVVGMREDHYTQNDAVCNDSVSFTGDADTNAVEITWDRYYGSYSNVLMRSEDGGSTWTNWVVLDVSTTDYMDNGDVNWNTNDFYSVYTDELEAGILEGRLDKQFPVFTIDLSYWDNGTNTLGTEVELKASTNNYAGGPDYWCDSYHTNIQTYATFANADHEAVIYFSDPNVSDRRQVKEVSIQDLQDADESLTDYIGGSALYSAPTIIVVPDADNEKWSDWMTESNSENISWMWRARTALDNGPMDSDGDVIWYPIRPDEWVSSQELGGITDD